MRRIKVRLTYANVMSTVAVFFAVGGVSYAATVLPRNSVGAPQLQSGAVTAAKLGFALTAAATTQAATIPDGACPLGAPCPPPPRNPPVLARTKVTLTKPGAVLIIATASLTNSATSSLASVSIGAAVDSAPPSTHATTQVPAAGNATATDVTYNPGSLPARIRSRCTAPT